MSAPSDDLFGRLARRAMALRADGSRPVEGSLSDRSAFPVVEEDLTGGLHPAAPPAANDDPTTPTVPAESTGRPPGQAPPRDLVGSPPPSPAATRPVSPPLPPSATAPPVVAVAATVSGRTEAADAVVRPVEPDPPQHREASSTPAAPVLLAAPARPGPGSAPALVVGAVPHVPRRQPAAPPPAEVTIGRVEIRLHHGPAQRATAADRPPAPAATVATSLEDYLTRRAGERS